MLTSISNSTQSTAAGFNPRAVAQLFKYDVMDTFDAWNDERPLRTGFPHASNTLAIESEYCLRKLVLMALHPEQAVRPDAKPWDRLTNARFKHGWLIHEKHQGLAKRYGRVVHTDGKPELDLTHYDAEHMIYFSPDEIIEHCGEQMPVEIKGYKQETFVGLDEVGPAPADAHKQVNLYMYLLKLQHGLIMVECKNTQALKTWCVEYSHELAQPYIDRMAAFKAAYQAGITPGRKCSKPGDRLAQKCEMCQFCFSH